MNFFMSIVKGGSASGAKRGSSASMRSSGAKRDQRSQANSLMDRFGRIEDRG